MKASLFFTITLLILIPLRACCNSAHDDDPLITELKKQLYSKEQNIRSGLHYPQSVMRFYRLNDQSPVWLTPSGQANASQAMLLLDCVLQYGLSPKDYHEKELSYQILEALAEKKDTLSLASKVRFEVMLTDAMLTMINNLHFGKANPDYPRDRIDAAMNMPFHGDAALAKALSSVDFQSVILEVQPHNKAYADLQYWMHLWKGIYTGDCYEVPDSAVRKVAINMERLRWAEINDSAKYIQVNIPAYQLIYHTMDSTYIFKVIVGKPSNPTPTLSSSITYFTTASDWMVPDKIFVNELIPKAIANPAYLKQNKIQIYDRYGLVTGLNAESLLQIQKTVGYYARQSAGCDNALGNLVFRFKNIFDVYLHDTPEQQEFDLQERDLSYGCIRLQNPSLLAELLLTNDGNMVSLPTFKKSLAKKRTQNFILSHPVPVRVTYITCKIDNTELVNYKDIYHLDPPLMAILYGDEKLLTMN